jgi:tetratricopeptide (TPR) repeat protein
MRKVLILLMLGLFVGSGVYAQKNKRTSAFMYNKNKQYAKAIEAIEAAIQHEKTINDAKTWNYRGQIYYNVAKDTNPEVNALAPNAAIISLESFEKLKELDTKNSFKGDFENFTAMLGNYFYNKAYKYYLEEDFNSATINYAYSYKTAELNDKLDTVSAFYTALCAFNDNNLEESIKYFDICMEAGFDNSNVFIYASRTHKALGDTTAAFDALNKGREMFPSENAIQLELTQLYLETEKMDELITNLIVSIENNPNNVNLYQILGQSYEQIGEQDKALETYKKAIEVQPDYGNAIFNVAAIYINRASEDYNVARNLPLEESKKYEELKAKGDESLKLALPYLERSLELTPNDEDVINALKDAYKNLQMTEELKALMGK